MSVSTLFDLTGKTAIVTGGTRGIGEMIATGLLKQGARVFITSRKPDAVKAAQERLSEFGEVHAIPSDLSTHEGAQAFADWLADQTDAIDILVGVCLGRRCLRVVSRWCTKRASRGTDRQSRGLHGG